MPSSIPRKTTSTPATSMKETCKNGAWWRTGRKSRVRCKPACEVPDEQSYADTTGESWCHIAHEPPDVVYTTKSAGTGRRTCRRGVNFAIFFLRKFFWNASCSSCFQMLLKSVFVPSEFFGQSWPVGLLVGRVLHRTHKPRLASS